MVFNFKEEEYRKMYKKYTNIFPIISVVLTIILMMIWGFSMPTTISDIMISMGIIIFVIGLPVIIISAVIYAIYETKVSNYKESEIKINKNSLEFKKYIPERTESKVTDKYKNIKVTNIQKVEETSYGYKITGNIEQCVKYKKNSKKEKDEVVSTEYKTEITISIPKFFGEKEEFEKELYKLPTNNKKKKQKKYMPFTILGLIELAITSLSFIIFWVFGKNNNMILIFSWLITEYIALNAIHVLKDENRDRLASIANIVLGSIQLIIGCILVFLKP